MSETTVKSQGPSILNRLEKWMPGIRAATTYNRAWLGKDLIAGIVLCALLVPQGMAYAELNVLGDRMLPFLGKPADLDGYHDLAYYPQAEQISGLLMVRWDAPLFFANANIFRKKLRDALGAMDPKPNWVLVAAEPVTDIDTTAGEMLADLDKELNAQEIHLVFAEMQNPVKEKIVRYGLLGTIDSRHFYPTLKTAVAAFYQEFPANETTP